MRKYLNALFIVIYTNMRFSIIKFFNSNGFKFSLLTLVSPSTKVEIGKEAFVEIGEKFRTRSGSKLQIRNGAELKIGESTFFNYGCMVVCHENIKIGRNVQLGPNVLIYDHDHDFKTQNGIKDLKYKTSPIEIGDNVWIGANSVILRGTRIGNNCVIGAGSIIKGNYEDNMIIVQKRDTNVTKIVGESND